MEFREKPVEMREGLRPQPALFFPEAAANSQGLPLVQLLPESGLSSIGPERPPMVNPPAPLHPPQPTVLDLFCGAGGLSLGFQDAGFRILAGVDSSDSALQTFHRNLKTMALKYDVRQVSAEHLRADVGEQIDVLIGGPSCQGFSTSGGLARRSGRDMHDPRNRLFEHYLELVDGLQPRWILFENVPGLLLYHHGEIARTITSRFRELGYAVLPIILLAADYGVPQLRRRLFFIGNRTGDTIPLPAPTHGDPNLWANFSLPFAFLSRIGHKDSETLEAHVSFSDACDDLPPAREDEEIDGVPYRTGAQTSYQRLMRGRRRLVRQHITFALSESDRLAARLLQPGQNWTSIPVDLRPGRFRNIRPYDATTLMKRLRKDRPAHTITTKFHEASTGAFIHPTQCRTLSVREAARLQSFPDRFVFAGSHRDIREQIGNAVPPLLAQALAEAMYPIVVQQAYGIEVTAIRESILIAAGTGDGINLNGARKHIKRYDGDVPLLPVGA